MWDREKDAELITWIEGNLKVKDTFGEAPVGERAHPEPARQKGADRCKAPN